MATFDFDQTITVLESNDSEPDSGPVASKTKPNKVQSTLIKYKSTASLATTNPSHAANISAKERAAETEFKGVFYEDGGKLFCRRCNVVVEHTRQSTIQNHTKSAKHEKHSTAPEPKKQKTVTTVFKTATTSEIERVEVSYS
jgi:hypothetical protein